MLLALAGSVFACAPLQRQDLPEEGSASPIESRDVSVPERRPEADPPSSAPSPIRPSEASREETYRNPALDVLLDEALRAIAQGAYPRAVSLSERAMGIDRYDPRVYLMLARAHRGQGNLALSRQFAERGLAVAHPESEIYPRLLELR